MLKVQIVKEEGFDDETQTFVATDSVELHLEHSLVSLSKWESKWEKPFLGDAEKTPEEVLDYVRSMALNDVDHDDFNMLSQENINEITEYINAKHSATWFSSSKKDGRGSVQKEIVTSELVYYWMVAHQIPFECQNWHLNRLMTLVRICNEKGQSEDKKDKMSRSELLERNRALNAERRAKYNTTG